MNRIKDFVREHKRLSLVAGVLVSLFLVWFSLNVVWPFIYYKFFFKPVEIPKPVEKKVLKPDPVDPAHPLPAGFNSYTGKIKKITNDKLVVERDGAEKEFTLNQWHTYYQCGNGQGKKEDLKPGMEVKVLAAEPPESSSAALAATVYYKN